MKKAICLAACALMLCSFWGCKKTQDDVENAQDDLKSGIIPGIALGQTKEEVFAVVGEDSDVQTFAARGITYLYDLDSLGKWGIDMPAVMGFDFDEDGKLYQYYYNLGANADGDQLCTDEASLQAAFQALQKQAEQAFGEGTETPLMDGQTMQEAAGEGCFGWLSWDTPQGELNVFGGMDMWSPGNHCVGISCVCDPESEAGV